MRARDSQSKGLNDCASGDGKEEAHRRSSSRVLSAIRMTATCWPSSGASHDLDKVDYVRQETPALELHGGYAMDFAERLVILRSFISAVMQGCPLPTLTPEIVRSDNTAKTACELGLQGRVHQVIQYLRRVIGFYVLAGNRSPSCV